MKLFAKMKSMMMTGIVIFMFTMLEIYFSMGNLSDSISTSSISCSFIEGALIYSLITSLLSMLIFSILQNLKYESIKPLIGFICLNLIWLYWNYQIFIDRKSAWSTYSFEEELFYTISWSILPVTIFSLLAIAILIKKQKVR